ncbi:hypothetical protein [Paenibacillus wulumuqiensis]|uniref:hypothetical protein n=1 Tax=Paenibacillus wulumuqiensis TaxID=1567107 RepID=UPI0006970A6F|nr:hypothetical protein [Paenibacillus wulumuqiensis]
MSVITNILAIESLLKTMYPTATFEKQTTPEKPTPNTFVIRMVSDSRELETGSWFVVDRDYQIIYFTEYAEEALPVMDAISSKIYSQISIPAEGIRFEGFNFANPELTGSKLYGTVGILRTSVREKRDLPTPEKVGEVIVSRIEIRPRSPK